MPRALTVRTEGSGPTKAHPDGVELQLHATCSREDNSYGIGEVDSMETNWFGLDRDGPLNRRPDKKLCSILMVMVAVLLNPIGLASVAGMANADSGKTLPAGSVLYLRLETPVSTKSSHLKQAITARVVRDVRTEGGEVVIPTGAVAQGTIDKLIPSSSPTDRAKIRLKFSELQPPERPAIQLTGHVSDIENARESVLPDGTVQGVLASELPITRIEDALEKLKKSNPTMGGEMEKTSEKTLGKGDTSIVYAAGTDFAYVLDKPLAFDRACPPSIPEQLSSAVTEAVTRLLADAPQRAQGKDGKPGDPLNLVFAGTQEKIRQAFEKAGWAEAEKTTGKSVFETMRAVMANKGYGSAPVSQLYLYGRAEDLAFQKMLNTFAKRHHLRIWKSPVQTSDGREVWLSAATHDIGWDIRPGVVSHAIDPEIDKERDKVAGDLIATGLVASAQPVTRPNPLSEGLTATGATWKTDGHLYALELK